MYNVNKILNKEEINSIFEYTRKYLADENAMQSLIDYHKKRYHNSFHRIKIILYLWEKHYTYDIEIYSSNSEGGEPKINYFKDWIIEYNHKEQIPYKTITN